MNVYSDQIKLGCLKYKIDLFDIDISEDLKNVLNFHVILRKNEVTIFWGAIHMYIKLSKVYRT